MARHRDGRRAARRPADAHLRRLGAPVVERRVPPPDPATYAERARASCFVCELVLGRLPHEVVYEDEATIAFLNRYPVLRGYTLVAPKAHHEEVTGDFSEQEYVDLQRVVWRVGEAIRAVVPCERLYVLSLGSQAANRHVHWHLAPLPPGVPFEEQQLAALDWSRGVLDITDEEQASLAARIGAALPGR